MLTLLVALGTAFPGAHAQRAPGAPIVILVSIDGWRHDYLDRFKPPALSALAARGVRSEGLIPSFPTKTFPNHYTIVTGLYPQNHGIVANTMDDPSIGQRFTMSAETARDARWWQGEPLWVTAEAQGVVSASMFWPGSEVAVKAVRPSYWKPYQDDYPIRDRVLQVLAWLQLPEHQRPRFITLYFSNVDTAGHNFGPDAPETRAAALLVDAEIAALVDGVTGLGLNDRVHFVIVSDHGMSALSEQRIVVLDDYLDMTTVDMIDSSPVIGLTPRKGTTADIVAAVRGKHPSMRVYLREETPEHLHYRNNPRIPPVLIMAEDGWTIAVRNQVDRWARENRRLGGAHGFDTIAKSMQGLLIATGPQFRVGLVVPPIENVHLYDMMARVLGLTPAPTDGNRAATNTFFR